MATDEAIEAAVKAMRSIRTVGGVVQDEVLRAYAHVALQAAGRAQVLEYRRMTEMRRLDPKKSTGMALPEME
jgi:hypothetical protein